MTFDRNELAEYETAVETIGNLIASIAEELAEERGRSQPNSSRIGLLVNWQGHLSQVRKGLDIKDHAAVRAAISGYGRTLRDRTDGLTFPLELPLYVSRGPVDEPYSLGVKNSF